MGNLAVPNTAPAGVVKLASPGGRTTWAFICAFEMTCILVWSSVGAGDQDWKADWKIFGRIYFLTGAASLYQNPHIRLQSPFVELFGDMHLFANCSYIWLEATGASFSRDFPISRLCLCFAGLVAFSLNTVRFSSRWEKLETCKGDCFHFSACNFNSVLCAHKAVLMFAVKWNAIHFDDGDGGVK